MNFYDALNILRHWVWSDICLVFFPFLFIDFIYLLQDTLSTHYWLSCALSFWLTLFVVVVVLTLLFYYFKCPNYNCFVFSVLQHVCHKLIIFIQTFNMFTRAYIASISVSSTHQIGDYKLRLNSNVRSFVQCILVLNLYLFIFFTHRTMNLQGFHKNESRHEYFDCKFGLFSLLTLKSMMEYDAWRRQNATNHQCYFAYAFPLPVNLKC